MPPTRKRTAAKASTKNDDTDDAMQSPTTLPTPALTSRSLRMSYAIGRGEQGVLTFEPYKGMLLPLWRFRTESIAQHSSRQLCTAFEHFVDAGDFVGADMARKFLQMGMTRSRRYANHRGGRKYDASSGKELPRSDGHEGREVKVRAAAVFRAVWEHCKMDGKYIAMKEEFMEEKKRWEKEHGKRKDGGENEVELDEES